MRRRWLGLREPVSAGQALVSGVAIWTLFFGAWWAATAAGWSLREPAFWPEWVEKVDTQQAA